jgi:fatty acid CoA ligase FadD9
VCVLGFASIDYTAIELVSIHLGAVVVPLQTSAPAAQQLVSMVSALPA